MTIHIPRHILEDAARALNDHGAALQAEAEGQALDAQGIELTNQAMKAYRLAEALADAAKAVAK